MTLENDCLGDFVEFSKKTDEKGKYVVNEQGEFVRDENELVCTCREYCDNQGSKYLPAFKPLEVPFGYKTETYEFLPKCNLYSLDGTTETKKEVSAPAKVRKVKKIKVSAPEKCNEDPLVKRIKEIILTFNEEKK